MKKRIGLISFAALVGAACGNDDARVHSGRGDGGQGGDGLSGGRGGNDAGREKSSSAGKGGRPGVDAATGGTEQQMNPNDAGDVLDVDGGPEGSMMADAGMRTSPDAAIRDAGDSHDADTCDAIAERAALLGPVDTTSTGAVTVLSQEEELQTVYVDASAGGYMLQSMNPWVYVDLESMTRVALTDIEADTSLDWDVAFKRDVIRSNSADSGAGAAEVATVAKAFADVEATDVSSALFSVDEFIDDLCTTELDATGKPVTAFGTWYDYNPVNMVLTPKGLTYLIRTADGSQVFKLAIDSYYSNPDRSDGLTSGRYLLRSLELTP